MSNVLGLSSIQSISPSGPEEGEVVSKRSMMSFTHRPKESIPQRATRVGEAVILDMRQATKPAASKPRLGGGEGALNEQLRKKPGLSHRSTAPTPTPAFETTFTSEMKAIEARKRAGDNTIVLQQHPAPTASMITLSQEQKGVTHGTAPIIQSDVASGHQTASDTRAPRAIGTKGKERAQEKDPYQLQADRVHRRRSLEDLNYQPPPDSQEVETPYSMDIDGTPEIATQEIASLMQDVQPNLSSRFAEKRPAPAEAGPSTPAKRAQIVVLPTPAESVQAAALTTPASNLRQKVINRSARKTPTVRTPHGIRNQDYDNCDAETQAERDDHIRVTNNNWDNPPSFWPDHLSPKKEVTVDNGPGRNGMRTLVPRQPKDVSTNLLKPIERLSGVTKNDIATAFQLMTKAVRKRVRRTKQQEKLLPEDVEQAIKMTDRRARGSVTQSPLRQSQDEMEADFTAVALEKQEQQVQQASPPPSSPEPEIISERVVPKVSAARADLSVNITVPAGFEWQDVAELFQQQFTMMMMKDAKANSKGIMISFGPSQ